MKSLVFIGLLLILSQGVFADIDTFLQTMEGPTICHVLTPHEENLGCPRYLEEQRERYADEEWWSGRLPIRECLAEFPDITQSPPFDVDEVFNRDPTLHYGGPLASTHRGCFPNPTTLGQITSEVIERDPLLVGPSRTEALFLNHSILDQTLVADNYYAHLRLRTGMEEGLKSLNLIDSMLDNENMSDQNCSSFSYEQTSELCQNLKEDRCQTRALAQQKKQDHIQLTRNVLLRDREINLQADELEDQRLRLQRDLSLTQMLPESDEKFARIRELTRQIEGIDPELTNLGEESDALRSLTPWIDQSAFSNVLGRNELTRLIVDGNEGALNEAIASAYEAQLRANREVISRTIDEFKEGDQCLRSQEGCDRRRDVRRIDEILSKAPHPNVEGLPLEDNFQFLQCLHQEADDIRGRRQLRRQLALAGGLTIAGFLVPPLGVAGRAAMIANAMRTTAGAARVIANAAMAAADIGFAAQSISDAYQACSSPSGEVQFDRPTPSSGNLNCEALTGEINTRTTYAPSRCVSSILFAGLDVIPLASFATLNAVRAARVQRGTSPERQMVLATASLSDSDRLRLIQESYPQLSEIQHQAIMNAHHNPSCAVYTCTTAQLRRKAEILEEAGIPREIRREIMQRGIAGSPPPSSPIGVNFPVTRETWEGIINSGGRLTLRYCESCVNGQRDVYIDTNRINHFEIHNFTPSLVHEIYDLKVQRIRNFLAGRPNITREELERRIPQLLASNETIDGRTVSSPFRGGGRSNSVYPENRSLQEIFPQIQTSTVFERGNTHNVEIDRVQYSFRIREDGRIENFYAFCGEGVFEYASASQIMNLILNAQSTYSREMNFPAYDEIRTPRPDCP